MDKLMTIGGHRVIINLQQSKIGYTYPRLFIEVELGKMYINFDVCVGTTFPMKHSDWEDCLMDAEEITSESEIRAEVRAANVNYERLEEALRNM